MQNATPTLSNQTHFKYELTRLSIDLFILHFQPNFKYFYLNTYEALFDLYTKITTSISACCEVSFERKKREVGCWVKTPHIDGVAQACTHFLVVSLCIVLNLQ